MSATLQTPAWKKAEPEYKKSFGEYMFDAAVYGGIGYLANAAISLAITRYAVQVKDSSLYQFGQKTHAGFEQIIKTFTDNPQSIEKYSDLANNILFLGSGGWLLIVPMKWMEDSKFEIVRGIDTMFGTGPKSHEDRQAQERRFEQIPRQSYMSLFGGRAITYPLIVAGAAPFITETTNVNHWLNTQLMDKFGHKLGTLAHPTITASHKAGEIPAFVDVFSKEVILAGTGAAMHFGFSKLIAAVEHHFKHDPNGSQWLDQHAAKPAIPRTIVFQAEKSEPVQSPEPLAARP